MANVTIKLTDAQKAKIKQATGQDHSEVRMGFPGTNPPATPASSNPVTTAKLARVAKAARSAKAAKAARSAKAARAARAGRAGG